MARVGVRRALREARLRRVAAAFVVCALSVAIPWGLVADTRSLKRHLRTGSVVEVVVERVKPARGKGGCRTIVFTLADRRREKCSGWPDPGDRVELVVDDRYKRIELRDVHVPTTLENTLLSIGLVAGSGGAAGWFLTGPGVAPRRACRAVRRRRGGRAEVFPVRIESARRVRSPHGRIHGRWRGGSTRPCFELQVRTEDGRALVWTGFLPGAKHHGASPTIGRAGDDVWLAGEADGWTWLYRSQVRNLYVPAAPLRPAA